MTTQLKTEDLGNGFQVVFQEKPGTNLVRAVVKNSAGEIVTRGPVVDRERAETTKRAAVGEWLDQSMRRPEPVFDFEDDGADIEEEDGEDGDDGVDIDDEEEEEDEDEELL